jgi:hypothetical protein
MSFEADKAKVFGFPKLCGLGEPYTGIMGATDEVRAGEAKVVLLGTTLTNVKGATAVSGTEIGAVVCVAL